MRDEAMIAARQQGAEGEPPPTFPPGPGIFLEGDPLAGQMFLQREVAREGSRGLFDDLVGRGFCLVSTVGDPAGNLSPDDLDFFTSIGGHLVSISSSPDEHADQVIDITGAYTKWFADNSCAVVLIRPDWAIYGTAPDHDRRRQLVRSLREQLHQQLPQHR